jgi:hypothetical protein
VPYIWEQRAGGPATKAKVFDLDARRTVDREAAHKSVEFMERSVRARKPFFLFYPITQIHFPTLPHPDLSYLIEDTGETTPPPAPMFPESFVLTDPSGEKAEYVFVRIVE